MQCTETLKCLFLHSTSTKIIVAYIFRFLHQLQNAIVFFTLLINEPIYFAILSTYNNTVRLHILICINLITPAESH